jgi:hypothetical protein
MRETSPVVAEEIFSSATTEGEVSLMTQSLKQRLYYFS